MIIISDGDPSPPSVATVNGFARQKIKISTVAVGAHGPAGHQTLQDIATATGGKYYVVRSAKALPRIFQSEARRVARPLIKDLQDVPPRSGVSARDAAGHRPSRCRRITRLRDDHGQGESAGRSRPAFRPSRRIARTRRSWPAGRTGWDARWPSRPTPGSAGPTPGPRWENYDKFFSQMIRWSMRPDRTKRASSPSPPTSRTARCGWSSRRWTRTTSS